MSNGDTSLHGVQYVCKVIKCMGIQGVNVMH